MIKSHIILASGWILFCILHSVFASLKFKRIAEPLMGKQYKHYRFYYTIFAFAGFAAIMIYLFTISSYRLFIVTQITTIIGIVVAVFGFIIMSVCILKYFMQLSGLKKVIGHEPGNELMITGIHKIVRHPLYTATFIFIWGLLILYPYLSLLIVDTIITAYTLIGLHFEEQKLEKEFGNAYRVYKQKVPMLIPRLNNS